LGALARLVKGDDPEAALPLFEQAVQAGDSVAMNNFAMLLAGTDPGRSRQLLAQAADAGHVPSMYGMGRALETEDPAAARRYYEHAQPVAMTMPITPWAACSMTATRPTPVTTTKRRHGAATCRR
jgi:hypothetical protein